MSGHTTLVRRYAIALTALLQCAYKDGVIIQPDENSYFVGTPKAEFTVEWDVEAQRWSLVER